VGSGTTFKLYFPRVYGKSANIGTAKKAKAEPTCGTESVLLVEDETELRMVFEMILKKAGYKVTSASHGQEGLDKFKSGSEKFDFVITDLIMPKMGGKAMADKIKEIRPELPILFMSGYTKQAISEKGIIEEGIKFIQKPFTTDSLLLKISEVIKSE
jgi:two-component system cell cycle sensor histidine kinase/response regulator CckA